MSKRMDGIAVQRSDTAATPVVETVAPTTSKDTTSVTPEVTALPAIIPVTPKDDSYETLFPEPVVAISAPPTWIWWSLLGVATLGLGFLGYNVANGKVSAWLAPASTPNTQPIALSIPIATPSQKTTTPAPSAPATASPISTASPTASPQTSVTSGTVRILNGTSTEGAATKAKSTLVAAGFTISSVGNTKTSYTSTTIYYLPGHSESAQAVAKALPKYTSTLQQSADQPNPDTILVVLGPSN